MKITAKTQFGYEETKKEGSIAADVALKYREVSFRYPNITSRQISVQRQIAKTQTLLKTANISFRFL